MIFLFHGDDEYQSRRKLFILLRAYSQVDSLSEKEISSELKTKISHGLFPTQKRALILEQLFSLPQAKLEKIIPIIKNLAQEIDVFIWEKKKIDRQKISLLGEKVKTYSFPLPPDLFNFLDTLGVKPDIGLEFLKKTLKSHPPELVLFLLEKRARNLLQAKLDPSQLKGKDWQKVKLIKQAQKLPLEEIKKIYLKLIEIDWKNKIGQLGNSLENELILFIVNEIN